MRVYLLSAGLLALAGACTHSYDDFEFRDSTSGGSGGSAQAGTSGKGGGGATSDASGDSTGSGGSAGSTGSDAGKGRYCAEEVASREPTARVAVAAPTTARSKELPAAFSASTCAADVNRAKSAARVKPRAARSPSGAACVAERSVGPARRAPAGRAHATAALLAHRIKSVACRAAQRAASRALDSRLAPIAGDQCVMTLSGDELSHFDASFGTSP
jgi:hypothetical protein